MIEIKVSEIMDRMKAFILPKTFGALGYDGLDDPLGDAEVLTAARRGSLVKDTNGKLYYPTKGGFLRKKDALIYPDADPVQVTTSSDTAVQAGTGGKVRVNIMSVYQSSGGALTFYIGNDAKTITLYSQSIPNTTITVLTAPVNTFDFPENTYIWWAAAAGVTQYANTVRSAVNKVDTTI